jgi:hypothetical protein
LFIPASVAESRAVDGADDQCDFRSGIPAPDEEETEPPISEFASSQTRYCAELEGLPRRDGHDLMEEQIFQNLHLTAETFLSYLTETLGFSETVDTKCHLFEDISGEGVSWILYMTNPPEIMWVIAGTNERYQNSRPNESWDDSVGS